jgi:hypothetical protein
MMAARSPPTVGSGEQPRLAAERNAAQRALGSIVAQANPSVIQETREGGPTLEHVVRCLSDFGMPGEFCPLGAHPGLEVYNQWCDAGAASDEAFVSGKTVALALDGEDRINPRHRFERQGHDDRQLAARFGHDVGEHEEFAPRMRPAGSFGDRPRRTVEHIELVEACIGIGLKNPRLAGEIAFGVITGPVARIEKHRRRRSATSKWPIITNIDPGPPRSGLALGQYRHGDVVAMDAAAAKTWARTRS